MDVGADVTKEMAAYYRQRAAVYERVYHKPERQADLRALEAAIAPLFAGRRVLEIACGTGWWTPFGAAQAVHWLATDINPETMAIARTKPLPAGKVAFAEVDAYTLAGLEGRRFDAAFAGFWWSHVPLPRLPGWIEELHGKLEPGSRVAFLDNRYVEGSSTPLSRRDADGNTYQNRSLDDGSVHEVLKNFPTRDEALGALGRHAATARWAEVGHYWLLSYTLS